MKSIILKNKLLKAFLRIWILIKEIIKSIKYYQKNKHKINKV